MNWARRALNELTHQWAIRGVLGDNNNLVYSTDCCGLIQFILFFCLLIAPLSRAEPGQSTVNEAVQRQALTDLISVYKKLSDDQFGGSHLF